jgi:hypothetical protein
MYAGPWEIGLRKKEKLFAASSAPEAQSLLAPRFSVGNADPKD